MSYQPFLDQKWASHEGPDINILFLLLRYIYMIIRCNFYDINSMIYIRVLIIYFKFLMADRGGSFTKIKKCVDAGLAAAKF
jgi:hypothetical protein